MFNYKEARRQMLDCQVRTADVTSYSILKAISRVEREKFVPDDVSNIAYGGTNIHLGKDRYLLEPRTFAKMLELLQVSSNDLILDIGCGFGYSSAVISEMAELVISLEDDYFFKKAQQLLLESSIDNTIIYEGKLSDGISYEEKVDALIIQGGIEIFPSRIKDQVKDNGRVVAIFVNGFKGECRLGIKKRDEIHWHHGFDAYVPLLKDFTKEKEFIF